MVNQENMALLNTIKWPLYFIKRDKLYVSFAQDLAPYLARQGHLI